MHKCLTTNMALLFLVPSVAHVEEVSNRFTTSIRI